MLSSWQVQPTHPRYFGLFNPSVRPASIVADALVAAANPQVCLYSHAPGANEIERHVLGFIAGLFGYQLDSEGGLAHFTSGGQEANHTAVAVALTARFPSLGQGGLRSLTAQPVFYLSEEGHHSFEKVAHSTGLGRQALRFVPTDKTLKLDLKALAAMIDKDRRDGHSPFMVIGTAGTTSAGIIDPLPELAAFTRETNLWFHVDAAWGGAACISDRLRAHLRGIEKANSITCDAHKWFSVPVGAGMFFCRDRRAVQQTFSTEAAYAPEQTHDGRIYPFVTSMQWSRRFIGLKLFMMLAEHGREGIARRIGHQTAMGELLRAELRHSWWKVLNDTPLPVVCFTHPAIESGVLSASAMVEELRRRQAAWISKTRLPGGVPALRACITHYETDELDIKALVQALNEAMRAVRD